MEEFTDLHTLARISPLHRKQKFAMC
jgi:hypothetical protein